MFYQVTVQYSLLLMQINLKIHNCLQGKDQNSIKWIPSEASNIPQGIKIAGSVWKCSATVMENATSLSNIFHHKIASDWKWPPQSHFHPNAWQFTWMANIFTWTRTLQKEPTFLTYSVTFNRLSNYLDCICFCCVNVFNLCPWYS